MFVFYPKPDVFREQGQPSPVLEGKVSSYQFESVEYTEKGMEVHYKNLSYPHKGLPFPEAIEAINALKTGLLLTLSGIPFRVDKILYNLHRLKRWTCDKIELKDEYYCPAAKTTKLLIKTFLLEIGKSEEIAEGVGTYFALILQYDDAYRYRYQDIISETGHAWLYDKPVGEIWRLMGIAKSRDMRGVYAKTSLLMKLASLVLMIPKYRKAFRKALNQVNIGDAGLDKADRYYCLNRGDYDFFGQSLKERQLEWLFIHGGNPPEQIEFTF